MGLDILRRVEYYRAMDRSIKFTEGYGKFLGPLEQEILDILWASGLMSGKAVFKHIKESRDIALTTVLTVLERLAKKGLVRKTKSEGLFVFSPAFTKDEFAKEVSQEMLRSIFEISSSGAAASFVDMLGDSDPDELDRLSALIASKKKDLERKRR